MGLRDARVGEFQAFDQRADDRMSSCVTQAFPESIGALRVYYRYERATLLECAT